MAMDEDPEQEGLWGIQTHTCLKSVPQSVDAAACQPVWLCSDTALSSGKLFLKPNEITFRAVSPCRAERVSWRHGSPLLTPEPSVASCAAYNLQKSGSYPLPSYSAKSGFSYPFRDGRDSLQHWIKAFISSEDLKDSVLKGCPCPTQQKRI